ncbi:hypothetical protein KIN20_017091, partial [Parelaphostrongylus tenuis]
MRRPLVAHVNMSLLDMERCLRTYEGQKKLLRILRSAPQPPIPQCIIEACENLASTNRTQLANENLSPTCSVSSSQLENTDPTHLLSPLSQDELSTRIKRANVEYSLKDPSEFFSVSSGGEQSP